MQTGHISLRKTFSDEEATRKPSVFLGYTVTKKIAIILHDVNKAEAVLSDIFKSGISEIEGAEFRTTKSRKLKDQARAMAMKAAQEKATAMAKEIGQNIGKAFTITEESIDSRRLGANISNVSGFYLPSAQKNPARLRWGKSPLWRA